MFENEANANEESAREYWKRFEKESGERVLARTMGQVFPHPGDRNARGDWGLAILTESRLFFRKMRSENWLVAMFRAPNASRAAETIEDVIIPLARIASVVSPAPALLDRLFGSPQRTIIVTERPLDGSASGPAWRMVVDARSGFFEALRDAAV